MAWVTRERFLLSGKDLIGVQNLLKKHQALQAEIAGHEPRIKAVTQKGDAMVEEGERVPPGERCALVLTSFLWLSVWTRVRLSCGVEDLLRPLTVCP